MTRSKATLLRRSGVALYNVANLLDWSPTVIFQVGIGRYCKEVEVFREAWPEADLVGFEPHPEIVYQIDYPGLLMRKALGQREGKARLFWNPGHLDGASIHKDATQEHLEEIDVEIDTLDGYDRKVAWRRSTDRVLLWLDCEGSELDVLIGGEKKFIQQVDVINIELTGKPPNPDWPEPTAVNRWLLDHGFLLQYVHTQRTSSGQVDAIYVRPELFRPEYCCCPLMVEEWRKQSEA